LVELDPRFTKEYLKEQKREKKDPLNANFSTLFLTVNSRWSLSKTTPRRTSRIFQNLSKLSWSPA